MSQGERGFTIVELLVATVLALIVIGAAVTVMIGAIHSEPRSSSRAAAVQTARVAMERITRELRQATTVSTAGASQLSAVTYVDAATCGGAPATTARVCQVTYSCSSGNCSRAVSDPGTTAGAGARIVSGLASSTIFRYPSDPSNCDSAPAATPTYVCVELAVANSDGGNAITLDDGVALRNAGS